MSDFKQYQLQPLLDAQGNPTNPEQDFTSTPNVLQTAKAIEVGGRVSINPNSGIVTKTPLFGDAVTFTRLTPQNALDSAIEVETTFSGSTGPDINLYHNSNSPSPSNDIGSISWDGNNSVDGINASTRVTYSYISTYIDDTTLNSEDATIHFFTQQAGSLKRSAAIGGSTIQVYNGNSTVATIDASSLTTNRTYTLPDKSGTFALTSDISGGSSLPKSNISTVFETAARFSSIVSGGTNTFGTAGLSMDTTATGSRVAGVISSIGANDDVFGQSPVLFATFRPSTIGTAGFLMICVGDVEANAQNINDHFGFKVEYTAGPTATLYGSQADGSTESLTSALTTLATNDSVEICAKMNTTSSVDYYWRKNGGAWSSASNLTTNLPNTATNIFMSVCLNNAATATQNTAAIYSFNYER